MRKFRLFFLIEHYLHNLNVIYLYENKLWLIMIIPDFDHKRRTMMYVYERLSVHGTVVVIIIIITKKNRNPLINLYVFVSYIILQIFNYHCFFFSIFIFLFCISFSILFKKKNKFNNSNLFFSLTYFLHW